VSRVGQGLGPLLRVVGSLVWGFLKEGEQTVSRRWCDLQQSMAAEVKLSSLGAAAMLSGLVRQDHSFRASGSPCRMEQEPSSMVTK
jgi:hypothetical protein